MTLRFTNREQLADLPEHIRRQIEPGMPDANRAAMREGETVAGRLEAQMLHGQPRRRLNRPEQDAGRELVRWADRTPLPGILPVQVLTALRAGEDPRELFPTLDDGGLAPPPGIPLIGHFLVHTPNGGWRGGGKEAAIFQGQGVRADWPDYTLALPRGGYSGLELELKAAEGGSPRPGQLVTLRRLEMVSCRRCIVAWGFEDAKRAIETYLDPH